MGAEWLEGSFTVRIGRKREWRSGWMRGAFGIHSYRATSEYDSDETIEVDVFVLTHLPTGYRMGAAFTVEEAMEIFAVIDKIDDWLLLGSKKQSREPRWQAAYNKIGAGLRAAHFGYALGHSESRVLVKDGTFWPPEQPVAQ
jgi:hypothetical protein